MSNEGTPSVLRNHVGLESMHGERDELLADFDIAKKKQANDPVQVEHGNVAESVFRAWLERFLPKRFGVTKGYIVSPRMDANAPAEEWDIIIYDALEAPTLYVRDIGSERKRGIPVEHVRAVVEVKAAFTVDACEKMTKKLLKLLSFAGTNESSRYPNYLVAPFVAAGVFFEVTLETKAQYTAALDKLAPLVQRLPFFMGSLVIRTPKKDGASAHLSTLVGAEKLDFPEMSNPFPVDNGWGVFGSLSGYGANAFFGFIFGLLAALRGDHSRLSPSFYGLDIEKPWCIRLFDP